MSEWTVVTIIIALVGFVSVFVGAAVKIATSATRLAVSVDKLDAKITTVETNNAESHRRIWTELDKHTDQISDCQTRITVLEHTD